MVENKQNKVKLNVIIVPNCNLQTTFFFNTFIKSKGRCHFVIALNMSVLDNVDQIV